MSKRIVLIAVALLESVRRTGHGYRQGGLGDWWGQVAHSGAGIDHLEIIRAVKLLRRMGLVNVTKPYGGTIHALLYSGDPATDSWFFGYGPFNIVSST